MVSTRRRTADASNTTETHPASQHPQKKQRTNSVPEASHPEKQQPEDQQPEDQQPEDQQPDEEEEEEQEQQPVDRLAVDTEGIYRGGTIVDPQLVSRMGLSGELQMHFYPVVIRNDCQVGLKVATRGSMDPELLVTMRRAGEGSQSGYHTCRAERRARSALLVLVPNRVNSMCSTAVSTVVCLAG